MALLAWTGLQVEFTDLADGGQLELIEQALPVFRELQLADSGEATSPCHVCRSLCDFVM
jgi:hypothetical protein